MTLVRRDHPPTEPKTDFGALPPRIPGFWLGLIARGIKMNDRSVAGKMYFGGWSGREMRTGLSRRRGGRWSGSLVYCFTCKPRTTMGSFNGGKKTRTCAFPICFSVDSVRLIGVGFVGQTGIRPVPLGGPSSLCNLLGGRGRAGSATASCIS